MKKLVLCLAAAGTLALAIAGAAVAAPGYTLFGNAQIVSPGNASAHAVQASSIGAPGYGGIDFAVPAGLTVGQLNNLATDYQFTAGSCGLGSPRFAAETPSGSIFFYIGPPPSYTGCPPNVWTNTGNLASPTNLVDASQLGGTFYEPYAAVQLAYGDLPVTDISLVVDGPNQTVQFDNTQVNDTTYTYDQPATKDECKDGGWQNLTDAQGNHFANQGDCVSYGATQGKNGGNG